MELYSFKIEGFRRHLNTQILFSDATFLIGENNVGKSSVLKALEYFLSGKSKISIDDFSRTFDKEDSLECVIAEKVVLTAEFRNLPEEANDWRGFKGRLIPYDIEPDSDETGLSCVYRKTFFPDKDFACEMKEYKRELKAEYISCKTLADFIEVGLDQSIVDELFPDEKLTKKINLKEINYLKDNNVSEVFDVYESEEDWFLNPGGIPNIVLSRLPKFLLIPAQDKVDELSGTNGALIKTLTSLFDDVRDSSHNFKEAQKYLTLLAAELDPEDETSDFSIMLKDLNKVVGEVFPNTLFDARANLSDAKEILKPKFDIKLESNISTKVEQQGTGVIRSAVFAMLRYRSMRENERSRKENSSVRPLFIAFEEPEIYLHPKAAFQMRETIYQLAQEPLNQIVCTTHSPYMIDLSKKSSQILNSLQFNKKQVNYKDRENKIEVESITANPFNVTKAFKSLQEDDQSYVKLLLKIDDSIAKIFFARNILIIEGDTEDLVFKETINRMNEEQRKDVAYSWEIVKSRGKATIISLVKYLKAMGFRPHVVHDLDAGKEHAEKFNAPIQEAVGDTTQIFTLINCIEDILGYPAPSSNKPFKAHEHIQKSWGQDWEGITEGWRTIVESIFFNSNVAQQDRDTAMCEVASVLEEIAPTNDNKND
ncbi:AAA family ATPase [Paenibacillus kribbensis]|uniref:ATP-dependent nuclease n=1 Tax=Paenibacillus kribbensis TaxID=172713 RepID=UPI002DB99F1C|nr:AAA family ATPase [Paenibacillus kribbensis]MEC0234971.1 AAA family ATPase [Paenibacillus kribbensis]